MRNTHMKFQIPNIHHSKVNTHTHTQTDRQTDRQAESNMPFQLFQSWGHKKGVSKPVHLLCLTKTVWVAIKNKTNSRQNGDRSYC